VVDVRGFIDFFNRNCLNHDTCERNKRFEVFIEKKKQQLKQWGLFVGRYCYDLNFAVNRKGENVLEHSRTGSRTPTSGTGRVNSEREEGKIYKGGADAMSGVLD
jgi:hypothetical protein